LYIASDFIGKNSAAESIIFLDLKILLEIINNYNPTHKIAALSFIDVDQAVPGIIKRPFYISMPPLPKYLIRRGWKTRGGSVAVRC
jgi:hypothetical protein